MKTRTIFLLALLPLVGFAVFWSARGRGAPTPDAAMLVPAPAPAESANPLASAAAPSARAELPPTKAQPSAAHELSGDALLQALRRLGLASMVRDGEVEQALRPFLTPPQNLYTVLEWLGEGRSSEGAALGAEEIGALRALTLGALLLLAPAELVPELPTEARGFDGRVLLREVLEALPSLDEHLGGVLARLLAAQRLPGGAPLVGLEFAPTLESLAAAFPERAELFEALLAELLALEGAEANALQALFVADAASPTLVGAGLSRWLSVSPEVALTWAAERCDDAATSPEVRRAITTAIAETAPVASAAEFLSERATDTMLGEFLGLGARAGGQRALEESYWALRVGGERNEQGRKALVSGMGQTESEDLLAIAEQDPSARVRSQAWITLTGAERFVPTREVLERLRAAAASAAGNSGVPTGALLSAASNFAVRARQDAALRGAALELLRACAHDPAQPESVRQDARRRLAGLLTPAELADLDAGR